VVSKVIRSIKWLKKELYQSAYASDVIGSGYLVYQTLRFAQTPNAIAFTGIFLAKIRATAIKRCPMTQENSYSIKLKDPRWQKKRLEILTRDEWACQSCFDNEHTLVVHHRLYLPNTEPWDYFNEALITLCEDCHKYEHDNMELACELFILAVRTQFFSNNIKELAKSIILLQKRQITDIVASAYAESFISPEIQDLLLKYHFAKVSQEYKQKVQNA
jgi:hypothetical protein